MFRRCITLISRIAVNPSFSEELTSFMKITTNWQVVASVHCGLKCIERVRNAELFFKRGSPNGVQSLKNKNNSILRG